MRHPDAMLVEADTLTTVLRELTQCGPYAAIEQLRKQEPVLVSFVEEKLAAISGRLALAGTPRAAIRGSHGDILFLVVGCLQGLRQGHYALWKDLVPADRLPSPDLPAPAPGHDEIPF